MRHVDTVQSTTGEERPKGGPMEGRKRWVLIQMVAGVALGVLLGWLLVRKMDWGQLTSNLRAFPIELFVLALGTFLVGMVFRTWQWHVLFVRERIGFMRLFLIQNAGIGLNNLSPVRVVSEPVQLALVSRAGGVSAETGLATLATQHLLDLVVSTALLAGSILLMPELRTYSIQLAAVVVLGVVSLVVFLVAAKGLDFIPGMYRVAFVQRAVAAVKTLGSSPWRLLLSLLATIMHWSLLGLSGWIVAKGLGIEVGVAAVVVLFIGSIFFVAAVPSLPGGVITFEAAVVYTMGLFGVPGGPALLFAFIMHVIMFVPSTVIAGMVLPREGIKMFGRRDPTVVLDRSGKRLS